MQKILAILTQYLLLPLVIKLGEYFAKKLEYYYEEKKLKEENEAKAKALKDSKTKEEIKKSFENMP